MKRDVSVEVKKAQFMVEKAMDDITRGTRKVLMDYVSRMYVTSFAKAIAYLGLESEEANSLLNTMDADTRHQVEAFAKGYQKSDAQVISEVEHIVTTSGMDFTDDYKIIKENIILSGKAFADEAVHNFQNETPIFQKKIEDSLLSRISSTSMTGPSRRSCERPTPRNLQKPSRELLPKSRTKSSVTCPSVQPTCLKKRWNGWDQYAHRM